MMKDLSVLQRAPFTDQGSIAELFKNHGSIWQGIRGVIASINENVVV